MLFFKCGDNGNKTRDVVPVSVTKLLLVRLDLAGLEFKFLNIDSNSTNSTEPTKLVRQVADH